MVAGATDISVGCDDRPMVYLKPPFMVRSVFNKLALATGAGGTEALTVAGRKTGEPRRVPVIPVTIDGADYIVSTRGESEWVRNVRAAGKVTLGSGKKARTVTATEIPVAEAGPIIGAYRAKANKTVATYWQQLPDDKDHPVFQLG